VESVAVDVVGAIFLLVISYVSYRLNATDLWGTTSGFAMGMIIALTSGWTWVAVLIAFLVMGSAATKYRYSYKLSIHAAEDKHGARGIRNVVANGAVATVVSVLNFLLPSPVLALLFVAALASAGADTLATEIGLLSKKSPVMIFRPSSSTPPGISGGVTALGEGAAFCGSAAMTAFAAAIGVLRPSPAYLALAVLGGFIGCNVDSILGGTVQTLYTCSVCGASTEKKAHCGQPTKWVKGIKAIGNNEVNLLSDVVAASLALFFAVLI
jgi:uncharacterized protein (TIGR00297 family)